MTCTRHRPTVLDGVADARAVERVELLEGPVRRAAERCVNRCPDDDPGAVFLYDLAYVAEDDATGLSTSIRRVDGDMVTRERKREVRGVLHFADFPTVLRSA